MSGRIDRKDLGQLAVMDAVVFFAGAILVSSVLLSYSGEPATTHQESADSLEVAHLLDSVLSSSIGSNLTIVYDQSIQVSRQALVRDCLAVEGDCLFRGGETDGFADLNTIVLEMLGAGAPPVRAPHLLFVYKSYSEPLLALPHLPDHVDERFASHVTLTLEGGSEILVVLVLCPSAPSELVQV